MTTRLDKTLRNEEGIIKTNRLNDRRSSLRFP